jgi:hypothetical protein
MEKSYRKSFADLKVKEAPRQVAAAPAAPPPAAAGGFTNISGGASKGAEKQQKSTGPQFGDKQGNLYMCASGDSSPDGTVLEGYRLKRMDNLFGSTCQWEPMSR